MQIVLKIVTNGSSRGSFCSQIKLFSANGSTGRRFCSQIRRQSTVFRNYIANREQQSVVSLPNQTFSEQTGAQEGDFAPKSENSQPFSGITLRIGSTGRRFCSQIKLFPSKRRRRREICSGCVLTLEDAYQSRRMRTKVAGQNCRAGTTFEPDGDKKDNPNTSTAVGLSLNLNLNYEKLRCKDSKF